MYSLEAMGRNGKGPKRSFAELDVAQAVPFNPFVRAFVLERDPGSPSA